ncbi:helix-turn-helix domain-containing protein [Demequina sp.]|uniref:helix-turn-helix domain-containing protein n=1 Tax=Demequina sp. TaxID=2050685 RepID=UPI0025B935EF|nr:helix-turn-helix domain-containing protein [Demequina sp.]
MTLQRQSRQSAAQRAQERGDLAAIVAARRQELGLSQTELGDLAGVSYRIVHHLESGRADTSLKRVIAVLETLGLHLTIERGAAPDVRAGHDVATQFGLEADAAPPAGPPNKETP